MNHARNVLVLAIVTSALGWVGCASTEAHSASVQPFHVALIPIEAPKTLADPVGSEESTIALSIDTEELGRAVQEATDGTCFARVTLLDPPDGVDPAEFAAWDTDRRDAYWLRRSMEIDADLVLECDLAFSAKVTGDHNEKFWLNLPLFLLGGPGCYFVDDRTYSGDARLRASLYEVHAIHGKSATFNDGRSRLVQVEARFQDEALDFLDRADGNPGHFATSFLIPAGLLARNGDGVEGALADQVRQHLAESLAHEFSLQGREVSEAEHVAPFQLESRFEVDGDDVALHATVRLKCGDVDRMEDFVVSSGTALIEGDFDDGVVDEHLSTKRERVLRYTFDARLPRANVGEYVRVEMAAGGRARILRSFTLPVDPALRGDAEPVAVAGTNHR